MRKTMGFIIALAAAGLLAGCSGNGAAGQTSAVQTSAVQTSAAQTSAEQASTEQASMEAQTSAAQEEEALSETENSVGQEESGQAGESTEAGTGRSSGTDEVQGGKTLVVYYSASGNTERVAEAIADATGGELFELVPVEPYTDEDLDYTDDNSRVSQEHEDESLRHVELVEDTVEDWSAIKNVYLGYPIWWQVAAWPVNAFIEANDFTGKTVIPFCTSASSGLGESGELLAEMAGTGEWLEGIRFQSSVSEEDVVTWVESLGLN